MILDMRNEDLPPLKTRMHQTGGIDNKKKKLKHRQWREVLQQVTDIDWFSVSRAGYTHRHTKHWPTRTFRHCGVQ